MSLVFIVRRTPIAASTLLALLSLVASLQAQQRAGYVLDLRGNWRLDESSSGKLSIGQTLRTGNVIRIEYPAHEDYIVVADSAGKIIASKHCDLVGDCESPIILPRSAKSQGSKWSVLFDSVMGLLLGEPDRYSIHKSRGAEEPLDRVVRLQNDRIDLGSVLAKKRKRRYYLRLRMIGKERPGFGNSFGPTVIDWDPNKAALISIANLHAGLYELSLLDRRDGDSVSTGNKTWILVSPQDQYHKAAASFDAAVALTKRWGNKVSADAARSFLRAHLDRLAMSAPD